MLKSRDVKMTLNVMTVAGDKCSLRKRREYLVIILISKFSRLREIRLLNTRMCECMTQSLTNVAN